MGMLLLLLMVLPILLLFRLLICLLLLLLLLQYDDVGPAFVVAAALAQKPHKNVATLTKSVIFEDNPHEGITLLAVAVVLF